MDDLGEVSTSKPNEVWSFGAESAVPLNCIYRNPRMQCPFNLVLSQNVTPLLRVSSYLPETSWLLTLAFSVRA